MKSKNIIFFITFFAFATVQFFAQTNPVVSNVGHSYNSGVITITYDVADAQQSNVTIKLYVSDDGGDTWDYHCTEVSGDIGTNVGTGAGKSIIWTHDHENGSPSGSSFIIRIIANDEIEGGDACSGTATVSYAGRTYNTIQIGNQCWLKENLNVGNMINSVNGGDGSDGHQTNNGTIEKYCYDNNSDNCDNDDRGGLYQWDEAMQYDVSDNGTIGITQGICPSGWHIPTPAELFVLKDAVASSSNAIKATTEGSGSGVGTNTSGFSGLHNGYCKRDTDGSFVGYGGTANFWSSYESSSNIYADHMNLYYANNSVSISYDGYVKRGFSVRCIKN